MKNLLLLAFCFAISASAFAADQRFCILPPDQGRGSLAGTWQQLPIHLALDSEFYKADHGKTAKALLRAVKTWNDWAALKGLAVFVVDLPGQGVEIPDLNGCSQSEYTAAMPETVGVWKINGEGTRRNQRMSCPAGVDGQPGKILNNSSSQTDWIFQNGRIRAASIMLNFEEFNAPGKPEMDMESVMVHELGHVLGLLHSCNGSSGDSMDSTSAPACTAAKQEYLDAVMFPYLMPGQVKRHLTRNDYNRVNCLY